MQAFENDRRGETLSCKKEKKYVYYKCKRVRVEGWLRGGEGDMLRGEKE